MGLDITKDHLPITPAAHYTCGGVTTDLHGRTNIVGLYSAGEAARTGLHGGNRLASTSLLEGLVFGATVADFVGGTRDGHESWERATLCLDTINYHDRIGGELNVAKLQNQDVIRERVITLLDKLKQTMWDNVGVVRTVQGLHDATITLGQIKDEALHLFEKCPTVETAALRDAAFAGEAVALSASANKVSAGAHCIILNESVPVVGRSIPKTDDSSEDTPSLVGQA
jgi:L-aspartate oxidase